MREYNFNRYLSEVAGCGRAHSISGIRTTCTISKRDLDERNALLAALRADCAAARLLRSRRSSHLPKTTT